MSSGCEPHAVLGDRQLETALEVVLVIDAHELADEGLLVGARDVVDADRLADTADDRLGELLDGAVGRRRVLDLFVAHLGGVDGDEGLVALDECDRTPEDARVEDDVAVHPQHAGASRGVECAEKALGGVRLVVAVVVDVVDIGERLDDGLSSVADDRRDARGRAERGTDVVVLLLHDAAAVVQLGQRFGQAAAEPRAHAGREDDGLKSQDLLLECGVCTVD